MKLNTKYEDKFNSLGSQVRVDESWDRYYNGSENLIAIQRYEYSIDRLYGKVLDVGSADGFGAYLMSLNPKIKKIIGIEIQERAINKSNKNLEDISNVEIIKGIVEEMPFEDNAFDSVHCGQTLEHVFDDSLAVKEIHRVVKDLAVFSVPIMGGISAQHVREYKTIQQFKDLLTPYFSIVDEKLFIDEKGHKRIVIEAKKTD